MRKMFPSPILMKCDARYVLGEAREKRERENFWENSKFSKWRARVRDPGEEGEQARWKKKKKIEKIYVREEFSLQRAEREYINQK